MKQISPLEFDIDNFIQQALAEDIGSGDHTSLACISANKSGKAELKIKDQGVIAGLKVAEAVFHHHDPNLEITANLKDGAFVSPGNVAFTVQGKMRSILSTERLVLNLMQRMSGVASVTRQYANAIAHTKAKVLDTRKTTPGLRWFEKEAVRIGGGMNHRFGLFDMILIKDNHVDAAGGIDKALGGAVNYLNANGLTLDIEIEVRSLSELEQALRHGGMNRVMLDNFSIQDTEIAVRQVAGYVPLESSGGIDLESIVQYAETGVDFISVGALTHSVRSLDLSLKVCKA